MNDYIASAGKQASSSVSANAAPVVGQALPNIPTNAQFPAVNFMPQYPKLPTFSGDDQAKGDVGFHRWRYELKSLMRDSLGNAIIL